MLFNSFQFLLFFPVVTILYFLIPHKWRWLWLLISSCVFYMAFIPAYILILFFTIGIDYCAGILIQRSVGNKRKWFLICSIIANVGVLAVFKYYNFFIGNVNALLHNSHEFPLLQLILPIGLSFHTFQAMSYTIEVYRGNQPAEKHFGIYALYVMFYPQLVAGPIERPQHMLHQFYERHHFDARRVSEGLKQMLWGFIMKVVIADRLAIYVNTVYDHINEHNGNTLLLATLFFAVQIYCDFAGYSNIALGSAKVMGFELMINFNRPYLATSIEDFWRRWHISLSSWFRDYVYIPLGGNRVTVPRWYFNLFFVFLLSGLWHGANWTFIVWGALNGIYLILGIIAKKIKRPKIIQIPTTFILVCIGWVFFRAPSLSDALLAFKRILFVRGPLFDHSDKGMFHCEIAGILLLLLYECKQEWMPGKWQLFHNERGYIRYAAYVMAVLLLITFGVFDGGQFIYFQF